MALKPCKECGKEISTEATTCPHCGKKNPTSRGLVVGKAGGCLLLIIILGVIGTLTSTSNRSPARSAAPATPPDPAAAARARVAAVLADAKGMCTPTTARIQRAIADHPSWPDDQMASVLCKRVSVGMTAAQVRLAWGAPEEINTTTYSSGDHEQWVYGSGYYVYIENGIVTAMQTTK